MVKSINKVKKLFYNPNTDSASLLFEELTKTHDQILKKTDLLSGTLGKKFNYQNFEIKSFKIPNKPLSRKSFPSLISDLFSEAPRWHSPRTMYNVAPPPLLPTVATKTFTSLYNPNLALDTASGESLLTEQQVVEAIAEYVGWDRQKAGGIFTWGGKATIMYGIKLGLRNCYPDSTKLGVKENVVVVSTASGHPAHISDTDWLGIGTSNIIRLKTGKNGVVNLKEMENVLKKEIRKNTKIAAIIISGGTTNNMVVDPIKKVVKLRNHLVKMFSLPYVPHIHVDAVVAFPWIFFKDYDFNLNELGIGREALRRISQIVMNLRDIHLADSFGIDFHKMGFCPYISSAFMVKDKFSLSGTVDTRKWPFFYSMENSRPADGPNSAYVALNVLGVVGFQILIAHLTEIAIHLQKRIMMTGDFEIINKSGLGTSIMFVPLLPKNLSSTSKKSKMIIRNKYTSSFVEELAKLGNPYYIDKIPGNSTGANTYPLTSLKAYIMSPYSTKKSNIEFVALLSKLKTDIDSKFDFTNKDFTSTENQFHPLKRDD